MYSIYQYRINIGSHIDPVNIDSHSSSRGPFRRLCNIAESHATRTFATPSTPECKVLSPKLFNPNEACIDDAQHVILPRQGSPTALLARLLLLQTCNTDRADRRLRSPANATCSTHSYRIVSAGGSSTPIDNIE